MELQRLVLIIILLYHVTAKYLRKFMGPAMLSFSQQLTHLNR